jgi:hypothetical protein
LAGKNSNYMGNIVFSSVLYISKNNDDVTMGPRPMCPETKSPEHCVPWMIRSIDVTSRGCCVPDRCVLTLNRIKVLVKIIDSPIYSISVRYARLRPSTG